MKLKVKSITDFSIKLNNQIKKKFFSFLIKMHFFEVDFAGTSGWPFKGIWEG